MKIHESIQDKFSEVEEVEQLSIFGPDSGTVYFTATLIKIPAGHEFPLHYHPNSEDCFFALLGNGELIEPDGSIKISAPACVWVPSSQPHGLVAGPAGILELGIQITGTTSLPCDLEKDISTAKKFHAQQMSINYENIVTSTNCVEFFPEQINNKYLNPWYAKLVDSGRIITETHEGEMLIIVVSGVVEIMRGCNCKIQGIGAIYISPNSEIEIFAFDGPALLFGVLINEPSNKPLKNDAESSAF